MLFSIGHSTLSEADFLAVLQRMKTLSDRPPIVMDIRSHPTSRHEHFRKGQIEEWLRDAGVNYQWEPALGGWRKQDATPFKVKYFGQRGVDLLAYAGSRFPKHHIAINQEAADPAQPRWTNQGLYDYSWFTTLSTFWDGAQRLMGMAKNHNVAMMCAEGLWWKCHRSMVADFMVAQGVDVTHLQPKITYHTSALGNRLERYHPDILKAWKVGGLHIL